MEWGAARRGAIWPRGTGIETNYPRCPPVPTPPLRRVAPPAPVSPDKEAPLERPSRVRTGGLALPTLEPPPGMRSSSPSPTAELMRGAGTTPILSHVPEPGFGDLDAAEAAETAPAGEDSSPWKAAPVAYARPHPQHPPAAASPFGGPPFGSGAPEPAAAPPADLFGFDHGDFASPFGAANQASAPAPFLEVAATGGPFGAPASPVRAQPEPPQASAFKPVPKTAPRPASALDDLNFAIQQAMGGGKKAAPAASSAQPGLEQVVPPFGVASASGASSPARSITSTGSGVAGSLGSCGHLARGVNFVLLVAFCFGSRGFLGNSIVFLATSLWFSPHSQFTVA